MFTSQSNQLNTALQQAGIPPSAADSIVESIANNVLQFLIGITLAKLLAVRNSEAAVRPAGGCGDNSRRRPPKTREIVRPRFGQLQRQFPPPAGEEDQRNSETAVRPAAETIPAGAYRNSEAGLRPAAQTVPPAPACGRRGYRNSVFNKTFKKYALRNSDLGDPPTPP